jgi:Mg2+-importing ATPase
VPLAVALSATLLFRGLSFWLPMLPGLFLARRALASESTARGGTAIAGYWALPPETLFGLLGARAGGLTSQEVERRRREFGPNELREQAPPGRGRVLWNQVRNPLLLLLVFAAAAAVWSGEWVDAAIVMVIVSATVSIGYAREYRAQAAAARLRSRVQARTSVLRDGRAVSVPVRDIVPGDVVLLSAGSLAPGDAVVLEATDFFVNEAVLTGESFPTEKRTDPSPPDAELAERDNCVFMGTNVRSGTARCLVVHTGPATQYGGIAHRLVLRAPETEFDRGIRRFGYLLASAMLVIVMAVFAANILLDRPAIETLLFSVALAVGLTPELLPAILSVNLARGAQLMARHGVLVRRLNAIENLGSMDVLCTDKTGTLTEGIVRLDGAYNALGEVSADVLELAALNAALESGLANPLDDAILQTHAPDLTRVEKLAEVPYDFVRKRLSIVVGGPDGVRLITKGAVEQVLQDCVLSADGRPLDAVQRQALEKRFREWSSNGIRVLAVATRMMSEQPAYGRSDERDLEFQGFLTFLDRPKTGVAETLAALKGLGVTVKLITGDTRLVARHVAAAVGMPVDRILTGRDLDEMHDDALWRAAESTELFVEVDPNQKERIILALKKMGHVVGFLGDGVNDAPAMHAADTSLSVDQAVDVAREAADFVLLERDLDVIRRGIEEGRRTFANTLKYVLTTTSANLGNMMSMAAASLFLPFLPLLAGQILLNNFLSDIPALGLADDSVDPELVNRPRRWNMRFIGRFMIEFGLISSAFDVLTFGVLLGLFAANAELFRSGWFVESLLTELVIALVVRTRRPCFRSRPGNLLLYSTLALVPLTLAIPYLPYARVLGFVPLPAGVLALVVGITLLYVGATEAAKRGFYRRFD